MPQIRITEATPFFLRHQERPLSQALCLGFYIAEWANSIQVCISWYLSRLTMICCDEKHEKQPRTTKNNQKHENQHEKHEKQPTDNDICDLCRSPEASQV